MKIGDLEYQGLSKDEVQMRVEKNLVNHIQDNVTKSYYDIFYKNIFTFFNLLNVILAGLVFFVGSYRNMLFIFIIIINTTAGIYQEIKAKKTLDKLSILHHQNIDVVRDNTIQTIPLNKIVIDDIIILNIGMQVPVDCHCVQGHLEVDESLLTGESDAVLKNEGDLLYSGSFITSGRSLCQVYHVGNDNYAFKLIQEAKAFKNQQSQLYQSLDSILKIISIIILPIGILLFLKQYLIGHLSLQNAIISTVAALLGMIPEGLILLTTVALTLSVLRLAKKQALVQDLFCIETLARVDTICLDKTGTITEGQLSVNDVIELQDVYHIEDLIGNMMLSLQDSNVTSKALEKHFQCHHHYQCLYTIPFSSKRKYSGAVFQDMGTFYIGAYQALFPQGHSQLEKQCQDLASLGYRILVLAHYNKTIDNDQLPPSLKPLAIITLSDVVRDDAKKTLDYFQNQGCDVRIISGDDPITVSSIAKRVGLPQAQLYIDVSQLDHLQLIEATKKYKIFGRVSPQQKKEIILALKDDDHTVAMTGDGVNDILAFKVADCSIAMASGSDAAKNAANIVLLDDNFDVMPDIVNEGRRVINNISASASMFLIKTIFSSVLAIGTIIFGSLYPFEPIQLSILGACCVGSPTFLLTYEANFNRVQDNFMYRVFKNAFPYAMVIAISSILIMNIGALLSFDSEMLSTICVLITGWCYYCGLRYIYSPMTTYRYVVIYSLQVCYFITLIFGQQFLSLGTINFYSAVVLIAVITLSKLFFQINRYLFDKGYFRFINRLKNRGEKNGSKN